MEADRFFALNFPASMISLRASIEVFDSLLAVNVPLFITFTKLFILAAYNGAGCTFRLAECSFLQGVKFCFDHTGVKFNSFFMFI